ncbi:MAG: PepSY domain-containing protein [Nitrososphaeraceae archaeon]
MSKTKNNYRLVTSGLIAVLVAALGTYNIAQNSVIAQEMVQNNMSNMAQNNMNFSSSINVDEILKESLKSKITITLSEAISIAETNIGEGSFAKEASLDKKHGYLVYKVKVLDAENQKHKVIVDPGTGEVLKSKKIDYEYGEKKYGYKHGDKYKKDRWSQ